MKRVTVECVYLEEGTKKEKMEVFSVYTESNNLDIIGEAVKKVYADFNNTRKPYQYKNFMKSFRVIRSVDYIL